MAHGVRWRTTTSQDQRGKWTESFKKIPLSPFFNHAWLFVYFFICLMNGLFQGSHLVQNHYIDNDQNLCRGCPGAKGRADGKFCASLPFPSKIFPMEALSLRWKVCGLFVGDLTQRRIKTLQIYPQTWPWELLSPWGLSLGLWSGEWASQGRKMMYGGYRKKILARLLISYLQIRKEANYLNLIYRLILSSSVGLYVCWSHVTYRP